MNVDTLFQGVTTKHCIRGHLRSPENLRRRACKLCERLTDKLRYKKDSVKFVEKSRRFRESNPDYNRFWRQVNPNYDRIRLDNIQIKLTKRLRTRLWKALKGYRVGSAVKDLGCSIEYLKFWLEYQFQPGMTWDNYGEWEIDHIKPLSKFNLEDRNQLLIACNWINLQPLWQQDNRQKGSKCL